jgi:hypothetical protein
MIRTLFLVLVILAAAVMPNPAHGRSAGHGWNGPRHGHHRFHHFSSFVLVYDPLLLYYPYPYYPPYPVYSPPVVGEQPPVVYQQPSGFVLWSWAAPPEAKAERASKGPRCSAPSSRT